MTRTVVCGEPPDVLTEWLERHRALGRDGHDEVWAGEDHMAPMADSGDESYLESGPHLARGVDEVLIVDPLGRAVEWCTRGADTSARTGAGVLLGVDEATLHGELDWPPT